jgi:hypothetical protein
VADLTAPIARLALASRQRIRTALRRGLKIRMSCNEPCTGSFTATIPASVAKRTKLLSRRSRRKSLKVASGRSTVRSEQRTVTLRFTRKAKKRLRGQKRLKLAIAGTASDAAGNRRRARKTVRLRR